MHIACPIIFTTAYDEYALKAFKVSGIDYLLKPIGPEELRQAVDKLMTLCKAGHREEQLTELIRTLQNRTRYKTHFLIPGKGDKLYPLAVEQVQYFYIAEGVVRAVVDSDSSYVIPHTLDELTDCLDPALFFRADLWFNNRLSVNLRIPTEDKILISKVRVNEFKTWFSGY